MRPRHLDEGVGSLPEDGCGPTLVGAVARTPVPGLGTAFAGLVDTVPKAQWYIFLNSNKVFTGTQCRGSGRYYPEPIY